jgi:catechol-2,3-dioxygenase
MKRKHPLAINGMRHVSRRVRHMERSLEFYRDILGFSSTKTRFQLIPERRGAMSFSKRGSPRVEFQIVAKGRGSASLH